MKYKCANNYNMATCSGSEYITVGKVYEFEMLNDELGTTTGDGGECVLENLTKQYHAQWEKV